MAVGDFYLDSEVGIAKTVTQAAVGHNWELARPAVEVSLSSFVSL